MTRRQADALLLGATAIWGVSFVAVKAALSYATPLAFVTVRFALGALALTPGTTFSPSPSRGELGGALLLTGLLAVGFATQNVGLVSTTPSRSAFIVALASVLAPPIAFLALGQRTRWLAVGALGLAGAGTYLLTAPGAGGLNRGDAWTLVTALVFGVHIVAVRELAIRYDARRLVWLQTAGTAVVAGLATLALERPSVRCPVADARAALPVHRAGGAHLLLRAGVRGAHVAAAAGRAAGVVAVGRRRADLAGNGAGGLATWSTAARRQSPVKLPDARFQAVFRATGARARAPGILSLATACDLASDNCTGD